MDGTSSSAPRNGSARRDTSSLRNGDSRPLLEVAELGKTYGERIALADVAFTAEQGQILGLIGPNGAGKTTLLEALAGLLPADCRLRGQDIPPARRRNSIFSVPDGVNPYGEQYVAHVLSFFARVFSRSDSAIVDVVASVGLTPVSRGASMPCRRVTADGDSYVQFDAFTAL